jgi:hypothetical protein
VRRRMSNGYKAEALLNNLDCNSSFGGLQTGENFPQMNEDYGGFPEEKNLKLPMKKVDNKD